MGFNDCVGRSRNAQACGKAKGVNEEGWDFWGEQQQQRSRERRDECEVCKRRRRWLKEFGFCQKEI